MRKARDILDAESREAAEAQKARHRGADRSRIAARASANGRLFGSITEADVVNAIRTATGISLDRHAIHMAEHLKDVGTRNRDRHAVRWCRGYRHVEIIAK